METWSISGRYVVIEVVGGGGLALAGAGRKEVGTGAEGLERGVPQKEQEGGSFSLSSSTETVLSSNGAQTLAR